MEIGSINSLMMHSFSSPGRVGGLGQSVRANAALRRDRVHEFKQNLEELETHKNCCSGDETDELDLNKDGVVDASELKEAGLLAEAPSQNTQSFLSLHGIAKNSKSSTQPDEENNSLANNYILENTSTESLLKVAA